MRPRIAPELIAPALQVIGIWLQLLNIAEENAAMRSRRRLETMGGHDQIWAPSPMPFRHDRSGRRRPGEAVAKALETAEVGPTITAHPTEAKRVTVLEIHRRIYLRLYELESPRWTPRERKALIRHLRNDIDLLWMTGEIRLEKPTVEPRSPGACISSAKRCSSAPRNSAICWKALWRGIIPS